MPKKQTIIAELQNKISELQGKLFASEASQLHNLHFASADIQRVCNSKMQGSGIILSIKALNGNDIVKPTMIVNGLSRETILAIKADLTKAYEYTIALKP